jgi:hypothetical protein
VKTRAEERRAAGVSRRDGARALHKFRENAMKSGFVMWAGAAALALVASLGWSDLAAAQQPPVRVRGTVEKLDGNLLVVKQRDGTLANVKLADNFRVLGLVKIALSDIKPGAYVGVSSVPQADGSLKALHVHQFLDAMRGVAEGHRPYDLAPRSMMTNATLAQVMAVTGGQTLILKYKDGEQKVLVAADTPVVGYAPGDKAELKPGAQIIIMAAQKQPDGSLTAANVSVGRGLTPPM